MERNSYMKIIELSETLRLWFDHHCKCYEHRKPWKIIWASIDEKYVLIHRPGETYSAGREQRYGPTEYVLVDTAQTTMGIPGRDVMRFVKKSKKTILVEVEEYIKTINDK